MAWRRDNESGPAKRIWGDFLVLVSPLIIIRPILGDDIYGWGEGGQGGDQANHT